MYLIFWCIVFLILIFTINLYLTLKRRQRRIKSESLKSENDDGKIDQQECDIDQQVINGDCSKTVLRSKSVTDQQQNSAIGDYRQINVVGNDSDLVSWIQKVIQWLYLSVHGLPTFTEDYLDVWLTVLNNKSRKLTVENGVYLEFVQVVRERSTTARLVDVKVETESADNIVTTTKAICDRLVIQVRVASTATNAATFRHNSSKSQPQPKPTSTPLQSTSRSTTYEIVLDKFSALLKVVCMKDEPLFVIRLLERPEAKVQIDDCGNNQTTDDKVDDKNPPPKTALSPDLIINGILNVLTSTIVDLNFLYVNDFPKYADHLNAGLEIPSNGLLQPSNKKPIERKLFVKIVNANNLYLNQLSTKENQEKGHEIYCTVEIDEPLQSGKTSIVRANPESPEWEQHFMLKLNDKSNEVLFQVFDAQPSTSNKNDNKNLVSKQDPDSNNNVKPVQDTFLGLGIVSVAELRLNPSQTLKIPLQTRPLEKAVITGELVVELLLMEHNLQRQTSLSTDESVLPATTTTNSSNATLHQLNEPNQQQLHNDNYDYNSSFFNNSININNNDNKFKNLEEFAVDTTTSRSSSETATTVVAASISSLDSFVLISSCSSSSTLSLSSISSTVSTCTFDSETGITEHFQHRSLNIEDSLNSLGKYSETGPDSNVERITSRSSTFLDSVENDIDDLDDSILKTNLVEESDDSKSIQIVEPIDPDWDLLYQLNLNVNKKSTKLIELINSSQSSLNQSTKMTMDLLKDLPNGSVHNHQPIKPRSKSGKFKSISSLFSGSGGQNRRISRKRPKSLNNNNVEHRSNHINYLQLPNGNSKHSTLLYSISSNPSSNSISSTGIYSVHSDFNSNLAVSSDLNSVSMPTISPLIDFNSHQRVDKANIDELQSSASKSNNLPEIQVTRSSFDQGRPKFGSFRWLRSASSKASLGRKKYSSVVDRNKDTTPDTIVYPRQKTTVSSEQTNLTPSRDQSEDESLNCKAQQCCNKNTLKPTLFNIHLDDRNKRSSIYSQMSFESIDSRLSIVDDSAIIVDDERQSSEQNDRDRRGRMPAPLSLTQSFLQPSSMYGKHSAKSKSDSHLFFCLDDDDDPAKTTDFEDDNDGQDDNEHTDLSKYFSNPDPDNHAKLKSSNDSPNDSGHDSPLRPSKSVVLNRNSKQRTSLYAKFISVKRSSNDSQLNGKSSSPDSSIKTQSSTSSSIKQRFKFRYSSKVPKLVQQSKQQQQAAANLTTCPVHQCKPYKPSLSPPPPPSYFITSSSPLNLTPSPIPRQYITNQRHRYHRASEPSILFLGRRMSYDIPQPPANNNQNAQNKLRRKSLSKSISSLFFSNNNSSSSSNTSNTTTNKNSTSVITNRKSYYRPNANTNTNTSTTNCDSDLGYADDDDSDSSLLLVASAYRPPISIRRFSTSPKRFPLSKAASTTLPPITDTTTDTTTNTASPIITARRLSRTTNDYFHPNLRNSDSVQHAHSSALLSSLSTTLTTNTTANYADSISQPDLNGKLTLAYKYDETRSSSGFGTDGVVTPEEMSRSTTLPYNAATSSPKESRNSRSKESKSLIRTIRKRLSFSGKRSKSVERRPTSREGSITEEEDRARSVPGSREPSMPKEIVNGKKHQESFSNISNFSSTTFLHDSSVLIIETTENGNKKHFVVTDPKQNRSKWRRKAVKLHLFNDHLFVASRISSSLSCQVCQKSFPRRFGKQGYQCRDCGFLCHKQCHLKVENRCHNSSIASLHLEPVDTDSIDRKITTNNKNGNSSVALVGSASASTSQLQNQPIPELMVTPVSPEETQNYGVNEI